MSSSSYENQINSRDSGVCLEECDVNQHHYSPECIYRYKGFDFQDQNGNLEVITNGNQHLKSENPFHLNTSQPIKTRKRGSLSEQTFDLIENLSSSAKFAAINMQPDVLIRINEIAEFAIDMATNLLNTRGEFERINKQYEVDHARVEDTILALRSSRTKLEAERARVQDLGARMNGIRFDHMTALAKCQVRKAEYEYRAEESLKLGESHKMLQAELERTKRKREKELVATATQMWNLKLMVGDMFKQSESTLRDGMIRTVEEIDLTLDRLNDVMNASIQSGDWSRDPDSEGSSDETVTPTSLSTDDDHYPKTPQLDSGSLGENNMEQYMKKYGSCTIDDETNSESTVVVTKDVDENPYWHNGEYHFWDSQFVGRMTVVTNSY